MKKLMVAIAICSMAVMTGCIRAEEAVEVKNAWNVIAGDTAWGSTAYKVVEIEGHRYIVTRVQRGVSVVHAESCPCKAK